MRRTPKLALRKDTLVDLSPEEAAGVAGAATGGCPYRGTTGCPTRDSGCYSDFQECQTGLPCLTITC